MNRKAALETKLTALLGVPVEITVRGPLAFTLSTEGDARVAMEKAKAFLSASGQATGWQVLYDAECDFTCAYFTVEARPAQA